MNISHYVELSISPRFFGGEHKKPPVVKWFELTLKLIHAISSRSGVLYPIALPDYKKGEFSMLGKRIRVFGEKDKLEFLVSEIKKHENFLINIDVSACRKTPKSEEWLVYTRVRFPERKKMDHSKYIEKVRNFEKLPQIKLQSDSNKNWFVIGIEVREALREEISKNGGTVSTYGFSHSNDVVALPDF